ncbi:alpha/beta hydrolase [soil metagenome]
MVAEGVASAPMEATVQIRGGPLALEDPGTGRPFLWGHGLSSSRRRENAVGIFGWQAVLPGWRVVRWDARGHGRSGSGPGSEAYRWDALGLDLLAVADHLDLDRFVAGGASLGCASALHAAVVAPERIEALVLVIPPTAWESRAAQAGMYEAGATLIEEEGLTRFVEVADERPLPEIFADVAELMKSDPDVAEAVLPSVLRGAAASDLPAPDRLRALAQPTLILAWDTDPGHPLSTARALAELLPNAELQVATELAHLTGWAPAVAGFLAG